MLYVVVRPMSSSSQYYTTNSNTSQASLHIVTQTALLTASTRDSRGYALILKEHPLHMYNLVCHLLLLAVC